jgi:hypothetical protein
MGLSFKASTKSASAPEFEDIEGALLRFEGVEEKVLDKSQFDPEVFVWAFTVCDADKKVIYSEGDPLTVDKLTSRSVNVKSKTTPGAVKVLKALMTKAEFAKFSDEDEDDKVGEDELIGRFVKADIIHNESGYPAIDGDVARA